MLPRPTRPSAHAVLKRTSATCSMACAMSGVDVELGPNLLEDAHLGTVQAAVGGDSIARQRIRGLAQRHGQRLPDQGENRFTAARPSEHLGTMHGHGGQILGERPTGGRILPLVLGIAG